MQTLAQVMAIADHPMDTDLIADCPVHGAYKPIIASHPVCPVCAREHVALERQRFASDEFAKREAARAKSAGVPPRYDHAGFKNYNTDLPEQKLALKSCAAYANAVRRGESGCLIMSGSTGTGKTHLAIATLRNVMYRTDASQPTKFAKYITSQAMADLVLGAYKRHDDSEFATVCRLVDHDLLILDEYGLDDQRDVQVQAVHRVLYARYDACKPTMLISNAPPEQLKTMLGDRLWSRLNEQGQVVVFNWVDQRGVRFGVAKEGV